MKLTRTKTGLEAKILLIMLVPLFIGYVFIFLIIPCLCEDCFHDAN